MTGPILRKKNSTVERLPKGYWAERDNRQKLFYEFAAAVGFDPLVPENWAGVTASAIVQSIKVREEFDQEGMLTHP